MFASPQIVGLIWESSSICESGSMSITILQWPGSLGGWALVESGCL